MKRVYQTRVGFDRGNCWETCVECITGIPAESWPESLMANDGWFVEANRHLAKHGLQYVEIELTTGLKMAATPGIPVILTGPSPRGTSGEHFHAIVGETKDDCVVYVHDPHPDGGFFGEAQPKWVGFFTPLGYRP